MKTVPKNKSKNTKTSIKAKINDTLQSVRSRINNAVDKMRKPKKKAKKVTKARREELREQRRNGILGIGLLLVVASIAYSTSVIFIGVDSDASRIALLPQALFALLTLIKAFSKFYK